MTWNGEERREGMKYVTQSLNEIKLTLAEMKPAILLVEKHNKTLYGNGQEGLTTKIDHIRGIRDDLKDHSIQDRWVQGSIFVGILGILVKLFIK